MTDVLRSNLKVKFATEKENKADAWIKVEIRQKRNETTTNKDKKAARLRKTSRQRAEVWGSATKSYNISDFRGDFCNDDLWPEDGRDERGPDQTTPERLGSVNVSDDAYWQLSETIVGFRPNQVWTLNRHHPGNLQAPVPGSPPGGWL